MNGTGGVLLALLRWNSERKTSTRDHGPGVTKSFEEYANVAAQLINDSNQRQEAHLMVTVGSLGGVESGTRELEILERSATTSLEEALSDLNVARALVPETSLREIDAILIQYLTTEREFWGRQLVVLRSGLRETRAGRDWTVPEDADLRRLTNQIEVLSARYNAELDRLARELNL